MRNAQGYAIWTDPELPAKELDTFTCGHCNRVRFVKPFQDPTTLGGLCKVCMKLICELCVDVGSCRPLEKKLEKQESRYNFLKSAGLWEGK